MHYLFACVLLALTTVLSACGKSAADTITVAVSSQVPHADILHKVVKPLLAEQGITLQVRLIHGGEINDYLLQKQVDANFFQHAPYLDAYNADRNTHLSNIAGVHIEPFGAYSTRHPTLADLPQGAQIVIPNDPSNHSRALLLLHHAGLIKVQNPANPLTRLHDITENPQQFKFREMDAALMTRVLNQVDLALISSNYVMSVGMNPARDALVMEDINSPYVNILVVRPEHQHAAWATALARALTSAEVKSFIEQHYPGTVLPAF